MNLLITGGAGYLGSVLVQKLVAAKTSWQSSSYDMRGTKGTPRAFTYDKIVVYDNLMYKQTPSLNYMYKDDIEFVYGDVRDHKKLEKHVRDADVIYPLAALVGAPACDKDTNAAKSINQEQVEYISSSAGKSTKIIYPNTNSGYGVGQQGIHCTEGSPLNPISLYGQTKCAAETAVLNAGGISLRLATVFGASQRMRLDLLVNDFVYRACTDGFIVLFEKDFKRNYIHIHDVALTFIHAMFYYESMNSQAFNVGLSSANLSKWELAQKIKQYIPNFSIQVDEFSKDKDQRNYIVSNEKLEKTGWRPYYTIDSGIKELIKAYSILVPANQQFTNR